MAIATYFHPETLTTQQYNESIRRLEAAGAGQPAGRLHHSCFGNDGKLMVFEIWESPAHFAAFGSTLMPILQDVGINPGDPDVMPIHHIIA
jgi:hypothetical protein